MTSLEFSNLKVARAFNLANQLVSEPHYLFCSKATSYSINDSVIETPHESEVTLPTQLYDDMIFGKKITSSDTALLTKKIIWTSNTVYDQYASSDILLQDKNFYVARKSGSDWFVYKCISNNGGVPSTTAPSGNSSVVFETVGDGYQWKYLYTYPDASFLRFSTDDYMPVTSNTTATSAAVKGSIDAIHVSTQGSTYPNRFVGAWASGDIAYGSSSTTYRLNTSASNLVNFYKNCIIMMTSGAADGEYRTITGYSVSGSLKLITIDNAFTTTPSIADTFEIYPKIQITGDGTETANCVARAVLDNTSGLLQKVEVLYAGAGYRKAIATVMKDASVSVTTPAVLDAAISPGNGHGSDPYNELNAGRLVVCVDVANTEGGNIIAANDYRTFGIIKNPEYQNLKITIDGTGQIGTFQVGETVEQYRDIKANGTVSISNSSTTVSGSNTAFNDELVSGSKVLITNGVNNWYSTVNLVSNNTSFQLTSQPSWSNGSCTLRVVTSIATGRVTNVSSGFLLVDTVTKAFNSTNTKILGANSSTTSLITVANTQNYTIQGRTTNSFGTFNQVDIIEGTIQSGTFVQDEILIQNTATAIVHSVVDTANTDSIAMIDVSGTFQTGVQVVGNTSGATFMPSNKYNGFIKRNTGEFMYVQNVAPISRASNKSERMRIVLEM